MQYGVQLDDAVTITDPTWTCVADVIAGMHGLGMRQPHPGSVLVRREPPTYTWTMLEDQ